MARTTLTKALAQPQGPQAFTLPHNWVPRSYQRELFAAYERGIKRMVLNWHRRSGKDDACLHLCSVAMADRPGMYLYVFPTKTLARDAMWQAVTKRGKFMDAFPPAWLDGEPNNTEMLVRVKALPGQPTGSIWKLTGAEDPNSLRGLNPVGVVLSEFAQHEANVWDEILSPILNENGGWIIFNSTPLGKNHFWEICETARKNPGTWFFSTKTVAETRRDAPGEHGGPVVPMAMIEQERREGRPEEIIQQESFCSFDGFAHGTVLGDCLSRAKKEGRIKDIPTITNEPVGVCFDIGKTDGTAAWYWQLDGRAIHVIDYDFTQGKDAAWWVKHLLQEKPYFYGRIQLPWDADQERFAPGGTTLAYFRDHFRCEVVVAEKLTIIQGLDILRRYFPLMYFNKTACERQPVPGNYRIPTGLEALGEYHRKWDDAKQDYSGDPVHDIHSHAADALRTGAVCGFQAMSMPGDDEDSLPALIKFSPFTYDKEPVGASLRWR